MTAVGMHTTHFHIKILILGLIFLLDCQIHQCDMLATLPIHQRVKTLQANSVLKQLNVAH